MKITTLLSASLLLASVSAPALAAATQAEADRIKAALETYVGNDAGVVDVKLSGDDYILTLDAAPHIAKINQPGFTAKVDPMVLTLRPKGNGQWDVSQSGPFALSWNAEGFSALDVKAANYDWSGVFDEALGGFASSEYKFSGMSFTQLIVDPSTQMKTNAVSSIESWSGSSTAVASGDGKVDADSTMTLSGMTTASKTEFPPDAAAAGMPNMDYNFTVAGGDSKMAMKGLKSKAVLDLVAWFVAHPSKDLIIKDQAQLKEKIAAALPLWDNLDASGGYGKTSIGTAMGQFSLDSATVGVTANGVSNDGLFREAIGFSGLAIPPGIAPPWTDGLIPSKFNLDFAFTGFDAEAPAKIMLANMDLAKDPPMPPETNLLLLPAFAPTNAVNVALKDGEISSPTYSITYDGALQVNFAGFPTGMVNIRMKGLEEVLTKVQAAATSDPTAAQAVGGLIAAKGFGKAEADGSMLWAIEVQAAGKILINGIDVSQMMGGPPPQQ